MIKSLDFLQKWLTTLLLPFSTAVLVDERKLETLNVRTPLLSGVFKLEVPHPLFFADTGFELIDSISGELVNNLGKCISLVKFIDIFAHEFEDEGIKELL
jgi:hypothetical protein